MDETQIIAVDNLILSADSALEDTVGHLETLDPDSLLEIGDKLNEIHRRSQLAIGAWLIVYEEELGYGGIKELAE